MEKLNYKQLNEYLQNNLPTVEQLTNKELRSLPKENILLINEYISLYNGNLSELSTISGYSEQGITNLMVIVSKGYLPLLEFKQNQLTYQLILQKDSNEFNSLDYSTKDLRIKNLLEKYLRDTFDYLSNLPEDVLTLILSELEYKDIINICQTSKLFNNKICKKGNHQLWKLLYQRDISDILPKFTDENTILKQYQKIMNEYNKYISENNSDVAAAMVSGYGSIKLLNKAIKLGAKNYQIIAGAAAFNGYIQIVEWMIQLGANDYQSIAEFAARGGNIEIVEWMIELGANDYQEIAEFAADGGNPDIAKKIVEWMLQLGAKNYQIIAEQAALGGHLHIVE